MVESLDTKVGVKDDGEQPRSLLDDEESEEVIHQVSTRLSSTGPSLNSGVGVGRV